MKTLIIYYSHSGNTRKMAETESTKCGADICEIKTVRPLGIFIGSLKAIGGKSTEIQPLSVDLAKYDTIKLYSPIWGSNTHPAFNAVLELLPVNKNIQVNVVSGSGKSKCHERISDIIKKKGCTLTKFNNIKASKI